MDNLAPEQRRKAMQSVRTRDTKPELDLRSALWAAGVRGWRLHPKNIPGRPDLVWIGKRVAVFVDGAFWHGHPDHYWGQSGPFWDQKIEKNRKRDAHVNEQLTALGWHVLRYWDFEVKMSPNACVLQICDVLATKS